ncbi:hypothetical protein ST47_g7666 [Ascochyta rabiei]|uniref:Uncharacterized protein n=1 Tax=Didymella rabiei TaxID=5454 RepID=A0A163AJW9_DIDRA|nr:hypothetical protein ST47_g7666 [Ascochyta rabiei]
MEPELDISPVAAMGFPTTDGSIGNVSIDNTPDSASKNSGTINRIFRTCHFTRLSCELRNMIYNELWRSHPIISAKFKGIHMQFCLHDAGSQLELPTDQLEGLPMWLQTLGPYRQPDTWGKEDGSLVCDQGDEERSDTLLLNPAATVERGFNTDIFEGLSSHVTKFELEITPTDKHIVSGPEWCWETLQVTFGKEIERFAKAFMKEDGARNVDVTMSDEYRPKRWLFTSTSATRAN